jgi:hypothetical protein
VTLDNSKEEKYIGGQGTLWLEIWSLTVLPIYRINKITKLHNYKNLDILKYSDILVFLIFTYLFKLKEYYLNTNDNKNKFFIISLITKFITYLFLLFSFVGTGKYFIFFFEFHFRLLKKVKNSK